MTGTEAETSTAQKRERDEGEENKEETVQEEPPSKQSKVSEESAEEGGKTETPGTAKNDANQPNGEEAKKADDGDDPKAAPETETNKTESESAPTDAATTSNAEAGDGSKAPDSNPPSDGANSAPAPAPPTATTGSDNPAASPAAPTAQAPAPYADPAAAAAVPQQPVQLPGQVAPADQVVEERGEVSALYVGRVIGKGGEMIRDLQARAGCRIDVDQNVPAGQPRVITYRGSRRTVDFAKRLVHMLCQENASEADLPLGEAKREFLVVPAQSVGKIIGRGGEMIRELQSRSQAKIQVDHSGHSGLDQSEKQVTITGTEQSVTKAKEMVLFLVANPMMDAMQAINMLIDDKLHRGGVWGSGPPYVNLPNQGHNMQPNSGGGGGGYDPNHYYGGQNAGPGGYGAAPGAHYGAPGGQYGGGPPGYQQQQPQAAQPSYGQLGGGGAGGTEMEVFYAAKNYMGRIIGQKGVTINDLQRRSSCDIQINQDVPPGQECEISIRGSRQGIETVKQMLREIIEIGPNHPYAGGNAGGGGYQQGGYGHQQQAHHGYGGYQQQGGYGGGGGAGGYGGQMGYQAHASPYGQAPQAAPYQQQQGAPQQQMYGGGGGGAPQQQQQQPAGGEWKSATSPDGQVYYYNERTGETQWDKPMGMP